MSDGEGLLGSIESLLGNVFMPALTSCEKWGDLSGPKWQSVRMNFLKKLSSYVSVVADARAIIADTVQLSPCIDPALIHICPTDILAAVGKPDVVVGAEKCVQGWCHEIEQILTQSEQIRKESDDVGPQAELEHWRKRLAKFDSLIASIKNPQCRIIVSILVAAKSKVLQVIV